MKNELLTAKQHSKLTLEIDRLLISLEDFKSGC